MPVDVRVVLSARLAVSILIAMRAAGVIILLCLGANTANAQPSTYEVPPAPAPVEGPVLAVEVAGTWSGKTTEPKNGWRAAILHSISTRRGSDPSNLTSISAIVRFDDHGAPAESGVAETIARSWGAGVRATTSWEISNLRLGVFAEGTVGFTRARQADEMQWQRDQHMMASGGIIAGTASVQLVGDFGWLVTKAGDGRIGPIASFGLNLVLD
jgi:hypothetical protein